MAFEEPLQRTAQPAIVDAQCRTADHDDVVTATEPGAAGAEDLARDALDAVAVDRAARLFLGDGEPEACTVGGRWHAEHGEVSIGGTRRPREDPLVVVGRQQPGGTRETKITNQQMPR